MRGVVCVHCAVPRRLLPANTKDGSRSDCRTEHAMLCKVCGYVRAKKNSEFLFYMSVVRRVLAPTLLHEHVVLTIEQLINVRLDAPLGRECEEAREVALHVGLVRGGAHRLMKRIREVHVAR